MRPRITLIAQGTSRGLRAASFGSDDGLDEIGRREAADLARMLPKVDRAMVSPGAAARQTAEVLGLDATVDERLRDCNYGRWQGLKFNQVLLREPRKLVSWIRHPETAPHGGETIPQVIARVSGWMRELTRLEGHTVAVTHSAVIRAAVVHVLEAELRSFWRVDVVPLAFADLRTNGRRWVLRSLAVPQIEEPEDVASSDESQSVGQE
ncbi:MAG: histidine phosphatase family protein [Devosia sp.]|nr:histidine phosphatase family protein [Devosia sp.]